MREPRTGGGVLPARKRPYALALAAALVTAAVTADVLVGGALRHLDGRVFVGGLPPRSGAWHVGWRTIVNGGQYWLVGSITAVVSVVVARRRRSTGLLIRAGVWLVASELIIRGAQIVLARTPPRTGQDTFFTDGYLSYPSGHAANAAACLLFIAAVTGASRRWTAAAHAVAVAVGTATVVLGYHWPTDAVAGWGLGALLACAGRALVVPRPANEPATGALRGREADRI
ncbi:phosphatase PAP2 family protein [Actinomadura bangladeshensis]|uniref:Phosphatase PAP2 family protein n=1 Tax=Actinomadura bangladeshensis TaxID=453573 RepID=A0A4R4P8Q7_9ACTN|nr:phosphatase PAP2 family protein [Actinomadura bangladeshensis]